MESTVNFAGHSFYAIKPLNNHPDDANRHVVVRANPLKDGEFVVHDFNSKSGEFSNGFYTDDFHTAMQKFFRRGWVVPE